MVDNFLHIDGNVDGCGFTEIFGICDLPDCDSLTFTVEHFSTTIDFKDLRSYYNNTDMSLVSLCSDLRICLHVDTRFVDDEACQSNLELQFFIEKHGFTCDFELEYSSEEDAQSVVFDSKDFSSYLMQGFFLSEDESSILTDLSWMKLIAI